MVPYTRTINYFSSSSFLQLEEDPVGFYLQRLGPVEYRPPYETSYPADVGKAFHALADAMIKGRPPDLSEISDKAAIELGWSMLQGYWESGALNAVGTLDGQIVSTEAPVHGQVPQSDVPIYGIIDMVLATPSGLVPLDWKTSGASRPGTCSPVPGYSRHWTRENGFTRKIHKRAGEPMEKINPKWATQLAIYNWLLNPHTIRAFPAWIDQVIPWTDGGLRVAQYRTEVGEVFQRDLRQRMIDGWDRVRREDVVPEWLADDIETVAMAGSRPRWSWG